MRAKMVVWVPFERGVFAAGESQQTTKAKV
jgi:hypothetical protein